MKKQRTQLGVYMYKTSMRVCVVGAGPAGLCAAKHSRQHGLAVTVFEQSGDVGGTWRYTECVDRDEHGAPVHTSMYRDLRVNLPKEVMMFPGYPHKKTGESYITSGEILEYLNNYADANKLNSLCHFHHQVKNISRGKDDWLVSVVEFPSTKETTHSFDVIFICNGLNNKPFTPELEGSTLFEGLSMHSHEYRTPEPFIGQTVLIVGGGPSAVDICDNISHHASKVLLSHHSTIRKIDRFKFFHNVILKPDVKRVSTKDVEFLDGTFENVDSVIYCTGFRCSYPFLDGSCRITEDNGFVFPLYKHFINANHPTMCVLGNMRRVPQFPTYDFQVRFFLTSLFHNVLPDKDTMLGEVQNGTKRMQESGKPKTSIFVTPFDEEYYEQLVAMAGIKSVPKVILKIYMRAASESLKNFPHMRQDRYTVLDDETFSVTSL